MGAVTWLNYSKNQEKRGKYINCRHPPPKKKVILDSLVFLDWTGDLKLQWDSVLKMNYLHVFLHSVNGSENSTEFWTAHDLSFLTDLIFLVFKLFLTSSQTRSFRAINWRLYSIVTRASHEMVKKYPHFLYSFSKTTSRPSLDSF